MYTDLTFLEEETSGDNSIKIALIELFLDNFQEFLESAKEDMLSENWQDLYKAAHTIKPSIRMFGISKMEPHIQKLVQRCREEEKLDTVEELLQNCESLFVHVRKELQELLNGWK